MTDDTNETEYCMVLVEGYDDPEVEKVDGEYRVVDSSTSYSEIISLTRETAEEHMPTCIIEPGDRWWKAEYADIIANHESYQERID